MPTIRGTGSLFLRNLLCPPYSLCTIRGNPIKHGLIFDHLYPNHIPHFKRWISLYPLIIMPVRDPVAVAGTWRKRGEKREHFLFMWQQWAQLAPIALLLPIDHPDRDEYLSKISAAVGVPLKTDWQPFNRTRVSRGTSDITDNDVNRLYDIPEIRRLYVKN